MGERIGIVGAGIGGLAAAGAFRDAGWTPLIFDKARGPGGRLTSKRTEAGPVDMGAQYFTARDAAFEAAVAEWVEAGVVAPWAVTPATIPPRREARQRETTRYVPVPRMSALGRHLSAGLDSRYRQQVVRLVPGCEAVRIELEGGDVEIVDRVIVNAPTVQALALRSPADQDCHRLLEGIRYAPCWAAWFELPAGIPAMAEANFIRGDALRWLVRNSAKPGRPADREIWVVHATPEWSEQNLESAAETVAAALWRQLREIAPATDSEPAAMGAHRWRYSQVLNPAGRDEPVTDGPRLGYCGDWVTDGRVEGAWLSGYRLARAWLASG